MTKSINRLPPLKTLPAFEAAARLSSFTLAAAELSLTQGAVSRQILNLEARLGVTLFERNTKQLHLTAAGREFLKTVRPSLEALASVTEVLSEQAENGPVTIGASSALASLWLMPRLNNLRIQAPDLPIRVLASDFALPKASGDIDLLISYERAAPADDSARCLFPECIFPVCSPDFFAAAGPIDSIELLLAQPLLIHDDDHPDWIGWEAWLQSIGHPHFKPKNAIRMNAYSMLLQAAVAGQGIALGWQHLVDDLLATGSLMPLPIGELHTHGAFYLRALKPILPGSHTERLQAWLTDSASNLSPILGNDAL